MKGRHEFSRAEFEEIQDLVREKQGASASRQKRFRAQLAELDFYVSDFSSVERGFGPDDLDRLVRTKRIRVTDDAGSDDSTLLLRRIRRRLPKRQR
jgi:hypothetical protein